MSPLIPLFVGFIVGAALGIVVSHAAIQDAYSKLRAAKQSESKVKDELGKLKARLWVSREILKQRAKPEAEASK